MLPYVKVKIKIKLLLEHERACVKAKAEYNRAFGEMLKVISPLVILDSSFVVHTIVHTLSTNREYREENFFLRIGSGSIFPFPSRGIN